MRIAYPETCAGFESGEVPDAVMDILGKTFDVVIKIFRYIFLRIESSVSSQLHLILNF
jgi:hypothetical protein